MQRARMIYNPSSGREQFKKQLPDILNQLERAGYETSCHATTGDKDATRAARYAVERNFDLVIAVGGDGTVSEVVDGIAGNVNRPKLGIIPAGTTNDYARALGIPRDFNKACQIIIDGHQRHVDVGQVNEQHFINISGGGTLTELTYEVPSKYKTVFGQLAYYVKGFEKVTQLKPTRVKIECKEKVIDEEIMLFLIANTHSIGGFENLAPDADLEDGYFDVLIVRKTGFPDFIQLAAQVLRGEHLRDSRVIYFQTTELHVTSADPVQLNLDGERGGKLPAHYKVLHKHITVITPNGHILAKTNLQ